MAASMAAAVLVALASSQQQDGAGKPNPSAFKASLVARCLDPQVVRQLGATSSMAAGDRILVPQSAFAALRRRGLLPRGFRMCNPKDPDRQFFTEALPVHCAEGELCAPDFVLAAMGLVAGDPVTLQGANFPKAEFVRFQAHTSKLMDHPEVQDMLTSTLEGFAALTNGTTIQLRDGPDVYQARAGPPERARRPWPRLSRALPGPPFFWPWPGPASPPAPVGGRDQRARQARPSSGHVRRAGGVDRQHRPGNGLGTAQGRQAVEAQVESRG